MNKQEIRINELSKLTIDWEAKLPRLMTQTVVLAALQEIQGITMSILQDSFTLLEYSAEIRILLDEKTNLAKDLTRGIVPLSLLTPSQFPDIMEEARSLLPSHYTFSASPADMALPLESAAITVITIGEESPYYGVLEFPIHRDVYHTSCIRCTPFGKAERRNPP